MESSPREEIGEQRSDKEAKSRQSEGELREQRGNCGLEIFDRERKSGEKRREEIGREEPNRETT